MKTINMCLINNKKVKEIYNGWKNLLIKNEELEKLAKKRNEICSKCNHYSESNYLHCNICKCYLPAKVRSNLTKCPIGAW